MPPAREAHEIPGADLDIADFGRPGAGEDIDKLLLHT